MAFPLKITLIIVLGALFSRVVFAELEKGLSLETFARVAFYKYMSLISRSSQGPANKFDFQQEFLNFVKDLQDGVLFENLNSKEGKRNCTELLGSPFTGTDVLCEAFDQCISATDLFKMVPNSTESLSEAIIQLCPVLLLQQRTKECDAGKVNSSRPSTAAIWGFGILFVTLISCCALGGMILLPLMNNHLYHNFITLFEGLAVGSLVSSAVFHLIPQSFGILKNDPHHSYLWRALIIFCGIYLFFLTERFMKFINKAKTKRKVKKSTTRGMESNINTSVTTSDSVTAFGGNIATVAVSNVNIKSINSVDPENSEVVIKEKNNGILGNENILDHHHDHHIHTEEGRVIGTIAWMIIFGDGLHNFIDGLSIGAAFTDSILSGISISVAVFCEELPHELGDFAILLSAGMTMRQAVFYNFLSACTCYLGLLFGILLGDFTEGTPHIFALAGGMFLYISLVDMIGELNETMEKVEKEGVKASLKIFLLQNIGIITGVVALFIMAMYSEKISFNNAE
ncbi:zinc transporter ZIP8-like [Limulus polyphemus]|uniref:Zinc transporter ZIP8-like n=1 Tax=Limulus polyphemus TaxID=6850 RepID=A0ABM1S606_LIMPO|nr:zinc transporter ZIP8-like [Limulus polyphemus]